VALCLFHIKCQCYGLQSFRCSVYRNLQQFAFSAQNTATHCTVRCATFRTQCECMSMCVTAEVAALSSDPRFSGMLRKVVASPYQSRRSVSHNYQFVQANTRKDHHHWSALSPAPAALRFPSSGLPRLLDNALIFSRCVFRSAVSLLQWV
jgi:hypothetical protein